MNQMVEVAMTVIDPGNRRWAQLLNVTRPVRDLLPMIISRLDLPQKLTYELIPVRLGRKLGDGETLQSAGIYPGEELQLKPVRNKVYLDLMNGLYKEAIGYASKQLWGKVQALLETIFRLDPDYPDPNGLREAVGLATGVAVKAAQPAAEPHPTYTAATQPVTETAGQAYASPQPAPASQPSPQQYTVPAKGRSGCATVGIVVGILFVVVVGVVLVGAYLMGREFLQTIETTGGSIQPREDEPVLGTGDVQVTLRWDNAADLDLHVIDPAGEEIWYNSKRSTSGGQLDVDANGTCAGDAPVENVFWPTGGAPVGGYQVSVVYYGDCETPGPADYEVAVLINGQVVDQASGTLSSEGETHFIGEYTR